MIGSDHGDTLTGDTNANTITGGKGADTINGGGGADTLNGGDDGDTINAGGGTNVTMNGGKGVDTLNGTSAVETFLGGNSSDNLNSGGGADTLNGQKNADTITLGAGSQMVKIAGDGGSWDGDTINNFQAGGTNDVIDFTTGSGNHGQALINGSVTKVFESSGTIANNTGLVVTGTDVGGGAGNGASASLSQVITGINVGTFDDADSLVATNDRVYIGRDDGVNSYIWLVKSDGQDDGFTGVVSKQLILTLSGFSDVTALSAANFDGWS